MHKPDGRAGRRGEWRRLAGLGAAALLLAGCATLQTALPAAFSRPSPPPRAAARPPARPPVPIQPATPNPAPAPAPEPAPPPIDLARLPADQVESLLGPPAARAASGSGERWTYRGGDCALDLFLFPDVGSGGLAVLDRRASGAGEQECLRRLRDARR